MWRAQKKNIYHTHRTKHRTLINSMWNFRHDKFIGYHYNFHDNNITETLSSTIPPPKTLKPMLEKLLIPGTKKLFS